MAFMATEGTVYLLHFERPYHGPMQHHVGFTAGDLARRLDDHRAGTGSKTTRRAFDQGIAFVVARTLSMCGLRTSFTDRSQDMLDGFAG